VHLALLYPASSARCVIVAGNLVFCLFPADLCNTPPLI